MAHSAVPTIVFPRIHALKRESEIHIPAIVLAR